MGYHLFEESGLFVTVNSDFSLSAYDIHSNYSLRFTSRPDIFFQHNQIVHISEIFTPFNCKEHISPWSLIVLFSDGSIQFFDTHSGIAYLSGPPNTVSFASSVAVFRPLLNSKKRYILMVLDDDLRPDAQAKQEALFNLEANFNEHSILRILDTWSLSVVEVPLRSPVKIEFLNLFQNSLNVWTRDRRLVIVNISILNTNSHMKISEDLKMDALIEQMRNIFQYCDCTLSFSPLLDFVNDTFAGIQNALEVRR